jgi:hypothetical protein
MENQTLQDLVVPVVDSQKIPVQESKKSNFLIILLSILLVLSISIAVFFAYQTQKLVKEIANLQVTSTPIVSTEPSPTQTSSFTPYNFTVDPKTGWKIFSKMMGLTFQFPSDWTEQPNYSLQSKDKSMEIWINSASSGIEGFKLEKTIKKTINDTSLDINYSIGTKNNFFDNLDKSLIHFIFKVNNKDFVFAFIYSNENKISSENVFDQIFSTIKFIN